MFELKPNSPDFSFLFVGNRCFVLVCDFVKIFVKKDLLFLCSVDSF